MATTQEIEAIHELIGTRQGYGRNRLTAALENRTPEEITATYRTMLGYSNVLRELNPEETIQLTNRLIVGLESVERQDPKKLGTYLEVVCFGEPLEQEHIFIHPERRSTTHDERYEGRHNLAAQDGIEEEEL